MGSSPAGWFDDGNGAVRWWDGQAWTDHVVTAPPADRVDRESAAPAPPPSPGRGEHRRKGRGWLIGGIVGVCVLVVGAVVGILFAVNGATQVAAPQPTSSTESEGFASVMTYFEALDDSDCDAWFSVTTQGLREQFAMPDCESFVTQTDGRSSAFGDAAFDVVSNRRTGPETTVLTVRAEYDPGESSGGESEDAPKADDYAFHLVRQDGTWLVEDLHSVSDGRDEWQATPEEKAAAIETLESWDAGYLAVDCDAVTAVTTAGFREDAGWADCGAFDAEAREVVEWGCRPGFEIETPSFVTRIGSDWGEIHVEVVETCLWDVDDQGNAIEDGYEDRFPWVYELVESDGEWVIAERSDILQLPATPTTDPERAAVSAVEAYNDAWLSQDCELFTEVTTVALRYQLDLEECPDFDAAAASYVAAYTDAEVTATKIEHHGPVQMSVLTRETYTGITDAEGNPSEPVDYEEYWVYTVDLADGEWLISAIERR